MQQLINLFEHSKEYIEIEKSIDEGINPILVHGTDIFVMQWIAQRLSQKLERDVLLLFEDEQKARAAQEHIADSRLLTTREMVWFDTLAHSHDIAHERIETLLGMIDEQPKIVCASVNNLAYKYPPKEVLKRQHIDLDLDSPLSLEILRSKLFAYGYERVEIVESRGQYSIRGGIVDIFSTLAELPYRIELFGDEVDSIRTFDIETQTSVEKFNAIRIYPCTELILDDARIERAIHTLSALMKNQKRNRREKLEAMLEQIQERTYVEGIDRYYSLFYEKSDSLLDYLNSPIVVLVGNNQNLLRLKQYIDAYSRQFSDYLERGEVVAEQYGRVFEYAETMVRLKREQLLISEHLIKKLEYFEPEQIIKLSSRELTKYFGKFDQLAMDLRNWKLKGYHIGIVFNDDERMRRFIDQMRDFDVIVDTGTSQTNIMSSQAIALVGTAGQGFMIDTFKAILMTEHEIFGEGKRIKRKKLSNAKVIKAFSELSVGDYIVHESHGIGQYLGVEQLKIDQSKKDFLKIKYAGDDFLYIPVDSAGVVQK
jgi:transcription-repair coupling factor (superfamily II helicase)